MARLKVRRAIIREWMSLASQNRRSTDQTTIFARDVVKRYDLPKSRRTPFDTAMAWLLPRTGKS